MPTHEVKIELTNHGVTGTVTLDGTPVAVRGIELEANADRPARVTLDLAVHDVSTQGDGLEVLIPESTASTLRALGWTPPAVDEERTPSWQAFEQLVRDVHRTTVWPEPHISRLVAEAGRARAEADRHRGKAEQLQERLDTVNTFVNERRDFIRVLRQYSTEDMTDYHRWTGHAEARLVLAEMLALELDKETGGLKTTEETPDA